MTAPYSPGDLPTWDDQYHQMTRAEYWALVAQRRTQLDEDHAAGRLDDQMHAWSHRHAAHTSPQTLRGQVNDWTPDTVPAQIRQAAAARLRQVEDRVLAAAAALDPADMTLEAQQVRETAASIREHREMNDQRNQWAAADAAAGRTAAPNARGDEATDHVEQRERYAAEYGQLATQLGNSDLAAQWYDMDVDAQTAASWANAGFLPSEAEQWHRGGVPVRVTADWADAGYLPREALPFTEEGIEAPARLTQQEAVEITTRHRDAGAEPHTRRYAQHLLDRYHTIRGIETMHGACAENPDAVADVVEDMRRLSAHAPRPQEADRRALERAAATGSAQLRAQTALDRLDPGTRPFDLDPPSIDPAYSRGRGHAAAEVDDGQLAR